MRVHSHIPVCTKNLYIQSTRVYVSSSEFGLPQPNSHKRVCLPPWSKGWGRGILACVWGVGESQFRRLEKKLSTQCFYLPYSLFSENPPSKCGILSTKVSVPVKDKVLLIALQLSMKEHSLNYSFNFNSYNTIPFPNKRRRRFVSVSIVKRKANIFITTFLNDMKKTFIRQSL